MCVRRRVSVCKGVTGTHKKQGQRGTPDGLQPMLCASGMNNRARDNKWGQKSSFTADTKRYTRGCGSTFFGGRIDAFFAYLSGAGREHKKANKMLPDLLPVREQLLVAFVIKSKQHGRANTRGIRAR